MDQRIDRRGRERVAADQQRVERERLAQLLVGNKARDDPVDAAPCLQARERRAGPHHLREVEKRNRAEPHIPFREHSLRIGEKAAVAGDIGRVAGGDLPIERVLVVDIVEDCAVLPGQAVKRLDREQFDIIGEVAPPARTIPAARSDR